MDDFALNHIYVRGEVSNCKYHSSGHIYFTLKDEKSTLRCVMFSSDRYKGLTFHLEDGQLIEACGNISVYDVLGVSPSNPASYLPIQNPPFVYTLFNIA